MAEVQAGYFVSLAIQAFQKFILTQVEFGQLVVAAVEILQSQGSDELDSCEILIVVAGDVFQHMGLVKIYPGQQVIVLGMELLEPDQVEQDDECQRVVAYVEVVQIGILIEIDLADAV